ncbi:MAG: hypothetical protein GY927_24850 [bacterium]|nr:hypothetical protein [bacterium]
MGMIMGMGHWLFWAIAGIIAVFALMSIVGWMRREKQQGINKTENHGETPSSVTDDPVIASSGRVTNNHSEYHDQSKHRGRGFWPWALLSLLFIGGLAWLVWNSSMAPGASEFKWILWTLLPMAGVISLLGIAQMTRRHPLVDEKKGRPRGFGFLTLVSGLTLGLASWFVWQPEVASFDGMQDNITSLQAKNDGFTSKLASRNTIIERLTGEVETGALRYAELEDDINDCRSGNEGEVTRLQGVISGLRGQLSASEAAGNDDTSRLTARIDSLTSEKENTDIENGRVTGLLKAYRNDSEVQSAKIASLEAELKAMSSQPAPATPELTTRTIVEKRATPLAMMQKYNSDETELRLTSGDYNMVKRNQSELVNGKRGLYYNITLRNPADGKAYKFASASYSKIVNDGAFKQSLDRVISDIRGVFDGKRNYQIYVQGKASAGRYNGKMAGGFDYSNVTVLENSGGTYGPAAVGRRHGPAITNDDLPNLRGAFLQEYIGKNYKVTLPVILDGIVSQSQKAIKQAVSIILFVED